MGGGTAKPPNSLLGGDIGGLFRFDAGCIDVRFLRRITHVRQDGVATTPYSNKLGRNRHGDFFRRNRADVETYGRVDTLKQVARHAFFLQFLVDGDNFSFGPDHTDVARRSLDRPAQHTHVVAVTAGDNDNVGRFGRLDVGHGFVEIVGMDFAGIGKTFAVGIALAIVDDYDIETGAM